MRNSVAITAPRSRARGEQVRRGPVAREARCRAARARPPRRRCPLAGTCRPPNQCSCSRSVALATSRPDVEDPPVQPAGPVAQPARRRLAVGAPTRPASSPTTPAVLRSVTRRSSYPMPTWCRVLDAEDWQDPAHGDATADRRRARRRRRARARRRGPAREESVAEVGTPDAASSTPRSRPPGAPSASGPRTPAAERAEALHEVAARLRARTEELAELMTREGGKPLIENRDEVGWTASAFDFYAELARTLGGPRDPAGRVLAARARAQGAARRSSPASCRGTTRCSCSPGSSRPCSPPATPRSASRRSSPRCRRSRSRRASTTCRPVSSRCWPAAATSASGSSTTSASTASRSPAASPPARGSPSAPRAAIARVNLELGGKDPFIVCAGRRGARSRSPPAAAPGPRS